MAEDRLNATCPYCDVPSEIARRYDSRMTVCSSCGAWFVWPRPTREAIAAHYAASTAGMPAELRQWREGTSQGGWYEHLARRIRRLAPHASSIVDVGAGGLELTTSLIRTFPEAHVEAWDFFPGHMHPSMNVRRVDLNQERHAPRTFDAVVCVAVIEHVIDPRGLLQLIRAATAPGGVACVVGPEVTSMAHRILRKRWPYYEPDEHITLPSLKSIEYAVALAGGGRIELRRINVRYSLQYILRFLGVPLPLPRNLDLLLPLPAGAFELLWWPH